jgi:hypothetical protein
MSGLKERAQLGCLAFTSLIGESPNWAGLDSAGHQWTAASSGDNVKKLILESKMVN